MNSLLILPSQPPVAWARLTREGEGGSFSMVIDASGLELRNRMMHRALIQATTDTRIQVRVRFKSTLVASDNGFEGFAVRVRGFQLEGSAPALSDRQVFDSNPEAGGRKAWVSQPHSEWTTRNFIIDFEDAAGSEVGVDYYTVELVVRAASGQVLLTNVECQEMYSKEIQFTEQTEKQTFQESALYSVNVTMVNQPGEQQIRLYLRDMQQRERFIAKGKRMTVYGGGLMRGLMTNNANSSNVPTTNYGFLKMRIAGTGQYDYYQIGQAEAGVYIRSKQMPWVADVEAINDYDLALLSFGMGVSDNTADADQRALGLIVLGHNTKIIVNDFIAPSQG